MYLRSLPASVCLVSLLLGVSACNGGPRQRAVKMGPVDEGKGSLVAARKFLEGRWSLESFEIYPPGKPAVQLKGSGTLTYDEFGNLTMDLRADQASGDLLRAAGIDIPDGVISSTGRTAVDLQNKTLTYIIQGQPSNTGPLSLNRPRHWQVDGTLLTLTTQDEAGKPLSIGKWRKAS
jgi:hypothetical protein